MSQNKSIQLGIVENLYEESVSQDSVSGEASVLGWSGEKRCLASKRFWIGLGGSLVLVALCLGGYYVFRTPPCSNSVGRSMREWNSATKVPCNPEFMAAPKASSEFFIQGEAYFKAIKMAIREAEREVFITDWHMTLDLKFSNTKTQIPKTITGLYVPEDNLQNLLLSCARKKVHVYILLYHLGLDVLGLDNDSVKAEFKDNAYIHVVLHKPKKLSVKWSHHEKLAVVDQKYAFIGGIDLAHGRLSNEKYELFPPDFVKTYNPFTGHDENKPSMPWQDIACSVTGEVVCDIAQHFVSRYNGEKPRNEKELVLSCPAVASHSYPKFLRSYTDWSETATPISSIYQEYERLINGAEKFIYIENQFFVTKATDDNDDYVKNKIGKAIVDRIQAAKEKRQPFKVYIVVPLLPEIELSQNQQLKNYNFRGDGALMLQLRSVRRVFAELVRRGIDPAKYIQISSLRTWEKPPVTRLRGVSGEKLREQFFTEIVYVHSKLLIVDDEYAIIASANLNDRSMRGTRDTEAGVVFKDSSSVSSLRRKLWSTYLGVAETSIANPIGEDVWKQWHGTAKSNTELYRKYFGVSGVLPDDTITTQSQIKNLDTNKVVNQPEGPQTKGFLVQYPIHFLEEDQVSGKVPLSTLLFS